MLIPDRQSKESQLSVARKGCYGQRFTNNQKCIFSGGKGPQGGADRRLELVDLPGAGHGRGTYTAWGQCRTWEIALHALTSSCDDHLETRVFSAGNTAGAHARHAALSRKILARWPDGSRHQHVDALLG